MLVENPVKEGEVASLKLMSGEEVLARLDQEGDDYYIVSKPFTLLAQDGQPALAPYMMTVDMEQPLKIWKTGVMAITKTGEGTANHYLQQTTSLNVAT